MLFTSIIPPYLMMFCWCCFSVIFRTLSPDGKMCLCLRSSEQACCRSSSDCYLLMSFNFPDWRSTADPNNNLRLHGRKHPVLYFGNEHWVQEEMLFMSETVCYFDIFFKSTSQQSSVLLSTTPRSWHSACAQSEQLCENTQCYKRVSQRKWNCSLEPHAAFNKTLCHD